MDYKLKKAKLSDKEKLYTYKMLNILDFNNMSKEDKKKVDNYIRKSIDEHIDDYNLIIVDNNIIGCYCSYTIDNYVFLEEIYIDKENRNLGIGTDLIKKIIENAKIKKKNIKLWVYKDNKKAIKLYEKLGFAINVETETRYLMVL